MKILAIETSCDETAVALVEANGGINAPRFKVLQNLVSSQIETHRPWGGVVPNLAKREHLKNLPVLFRQIFNGKIIISNFETNPKFKIQNSKLKIDAVAVTVGPGLEPCLWTGVGFAKKIYEQLSTKGGSASGGKTNNRKLKLIGVNHLEGHLYSFLLSKTYPPAGGLKPKSLFPAIALIVSGGHTILLHMKSLTRWEKLGETRDDAVGEAFDKVARMLNLPFPGGPEIEKLAKNGDLQAIKFPRPMINSKDYDFSFSGLKTSVLYFLRGQDIPRANIAGGRLKINERAAQRDRTRDEWKQGGEERASELNFDARRPMSERGILPNICASFQKAAVDVLVSKTTRAARAYKAKSIFLSGGVAANKLLRKELSVVSRQLSVNFFAPLMKYNTDNAAMIGVAAYISFLRKKNRAIRAQANLNL